MEKQANGKLSRTLSDAWKEADESITDIYSQLVDIFESASFYASVLMSDYLRLFIDGVDEYLMSLVVDEGKDDFCKMRSDVYKVMEKRWKGKLVEQIKEEVEQTRVNVTDNLLSGIMREQDRFLHNSKS